MLSTLFYSTLFSTSLASELVLYWGQASAGSQQSLGEYCKQTAGDIYVISFINSFSSSSLSLNIAGACTETFEGSTMLHCPSIADDIKSCQAAGKKVFVSLGGASGQYGFSGDDEGKLCAENVWNTFGGGQSDQRPFDDAVVDGFDLDIENGNAKGYAGFVEELRNYFSSSSKQFYISAAPQCPYPDASLGDALLDAHFDHVYIQFYNNYCALSGNQFNWGQWQNYATNISPNKDVKLFVGLPGSESAAGSGYLKASDVKSKVSDIQSDPNFGGIMLWDASQAFQNTDGGSTFADTMHEILGGSGSGSDSSSSSGSSETSEASSYSAASSSAASSFSSATSYSAASSASSAETTTSDDDFNNFAYKGSVSVAATTSAAAAATSAGDSEASASGDSTTVVTQATTMVLGSSTQTITPSSSIVTSGTATSFSATAAPTSALTTLDDSSCTDGQTRCDGNNYSVCDHGKWVVMQCADGTVCKVNDEGNAFCVFPKRSHHIHQLPGAFNLIQV